MFASNLSLSLAARFYCLPPAGGVSTSPGAPHKLLKK